MEIPWQDMIKVAAAFAAGFILGFEREYRDKPAGLRTIILITVGSALFSLLNLTINTASPDRIASNIVTGVGFVGAGVIFKEGMNVRGLTSAATIWVAAAIGMALGFGNYWMACTTLFLTLIVLTILQRLEERLITSMDAREFKFCFDIQKYSMEDLEKMMRDLKIKFKRQRIHLSGNSLAVEYKLKISDKQTDPFFQTIIHTDNIDSFEEL